MGTFVNADVIAKELNPDDPAAAGVAAGRIMHRLLQETRARRESFALETTLSRMSLRNSVTRLRQAGYLVRLVFLWVPSPEINVLRVAGRVRLGGHFVPDDDVRRRFGRANGVRRRLAGGRVAPVVRRGGRGAGLVALRIPHARNHTPPEARWRLHPASSAGCPGRWTVTITRHTFSRPDDRFCARASPQLARSIA
jgi:hypothetical protein